MNIKQIRPDLSDEQIKNLMDYIDEVYSHKPPSDEYIKQIADIFYPREQSA